MKTEFLEKILDYSLILLYDCSSLSKVAIKNDMLIKIFIRNSMKVASVRRLLVQYFEEHLGGKSAINEGPGRRVLDWIKFHNALKRRPGYEKIVPFTVLDRCVVKEIRFVKYRILSYEVENNINGTYTYVYFFSREAIYY